MMTTTNDAGPVVMDHLVGDHGRLAVRLAAAELRLAATDGDRIVVRTPGGRTLSDRVVFETTDDGLTIREKDIFGLTFSLGRKVVQLEIDVPAMAEVSTETASGWLDVHGLTGEQRYRTVSGETRLRDAAGQIELTTVSGDATIELAGATDLGIKSVSGDAVIRGGRLDALRIGTTSGDIRVDSPLVGRSGNKIETLSGDVQLVAAGGMRVEARTVSGDLMSDLPHRSEGRAGRRTLIVGDGSIELSFRSVSGDLRIHDGSRRSGAPEPPVAPVPPFTTFAPFSVAMPEMPEMPDMPEMPEMPDLSNLGVPGFGPRRTGQRDDARATTDPSIVDEAVASDDGVETRRMEILRALEQGDLDVPTAMERLAALDAAAGPGGEHADG